MPSSYMQGLELYDEVVADARCVHVCMCACTTMHAHALRHVQGVHSHALRNVQGILAHA